MEQIPELLLQLLQKQYTEKEVNKILEGYQTKRETTLRVNTLKATVEEIKQILQSKKIEFEQMPWYPEAFVLRNIQETEIEKWKIYEQGKVYLQSLSSMLPVLLLEPKKNVDILDMAAAPGGKTTQLAALTQNTANITACEMNKMRAERLKYNIEKQGASSVYVMVTDSRKLDSYFSFDQILLDTPCSGSGTITVGERRKFTKEWLEKINHTQFTLLQKAISLLKPGGTMVYSTCSILSCENEEIVKKVLKPGKIELESLPIENLLIPQLPTKLSGTITICPNNLWEGFFVATLRKLK